MPILNTKKELPEPYHRHLWCLPVLISIFVLFTILVSRAQTFPEQKADTSAGAMVVAAHPQAVSTGIDILRHGGNAIDAAVAMAFVIGVAEPHASGLGGGGAMLIYQQDSGEFNYLDYYVRSPGALDTSYTGRGSVATPLAVCIPGTPAGLVTAAVKFGKLGLSKVIAPALSLARSGIVVNQGLHDAMLEKIEVIMSFPETERIYFQEGLPTAIGDTIFNPGLVSMLEGIEEYGHDYFYQGTFAHHAAEEISRMGGTITYEDFSSYQAMEKIPIQIVYKGYDIVSAPPPQSGVTLLEILKILEHAPTDYFRDIQHHAGSAHLLIEAIKLADADRYQFLGDPAFVNVPVRGLLHPEYTRERFQRIRPTERLAQNNRMIPAGDPFRYEVPANPEQREENGHTTHISVLDNAGNAVSLTQTLGLFFGSGITIDGILLNSSMSVFYNADVANRIEPQKRPASTICPTMIIKNKNLIGVLGTPGGGHIFNTMVQVILNLIEFGYAPVDALDTPRLSPRISREYIQVESRFEKGVLDTLKQFGHTLRLAGDYNVYLGGVQLIFRDDALEKFIGVSDIRRDGAAMGLEAGQDERSKIKD